MEDSILRKYTHGLYFNSLGEAEITVWAPLREKVEIAVQGKQVRLSLSKKELGYWSDTTSAIKPHDLYTIILDGEKERPDPAARSLPQGVHGPSQAIDLHNFSWTDYNWKNIPLTDYFIYEIHTGTFSPEGTFSGIQKKLDYLSDLGVTAIEIMPVAQFPGTRNWGYDGTAPYAVQSSYGGPRELQRLVDACHAKGIAVILDVVYNHLGPEGNYLPDFGPYFTVKYSTPWGNAINFDDEYCDGVRQYFIQNALMWLKDFHIDALRMDAVHAIKDFSPVHILRELKIRLDEFMRDSGRRHYLIVELDLNDNRYINPLDQQGYGMDAQWIDEFHHALRVTAGEERSGYYSDFDGLPHLAKAYKDAYVFDGQYSPHRKKFFGIKAENNPGDQFVVFSQNHDQVGNRMLGERTSQLLSFEMQKILAAAVIMSPFLPMLFMGEEWSEPHPFLYFVSHTDPELADNVRKGRKAEFAAFHTQGEAPDPLSETTFESSKLQWQLLDNDPHRTMLRYYKHLISLRKRYPALRTPDRHRTEVIHQEDRKCLILHRWDPNDHVVCITNFSNQKQQVVLPPIKTQWKKLLYSAEKMWGGPVQNDEISIATETVTLQPESVLIIF